MEQINCNPKQQNVTKLGEIFSEEQIELINQMFMYCVFEHQSFYEELFEYFEVIEEELLEKGFRPCCLAYSLSIHYAKDIFPELVEVA